MSLMRVEKGCLLNNLEQSSSGEQTCILDFIMCQRMKMNSPADCTPALTAASLLKDLHSV